VPTLVVREAEGLQVALALVEADSSYQEQNWPVVVVVAAAAATDNNIEIDAIGSTDSIDMQMPCTDPLLLDSRDIRSVDMLEDKKQPKKLVNSLVVELFKMNKKFKIKNI
jgi:hypothetical protein